MNYLINTCAGRDTEHIRRLYNFRELQHMYLYSAPAYVYYVKHIPSGKFYYGFRSANVAKNILPVNDLWVRYFTSSKKIKELRKQEDKFEVSILFESTNIEEVYWSEQSYIKANIENPLCLNRYYIDKDNNQKIFSFHGQSHSELTREKLRGHVPWNKGILSPTGKPSWNRGIPTPDSTKQLIIQKTTGLLKTQQTRERMRKPKSAAHRAKMSLSAKTRPRFPCDICGKIVTLPNINLHRNSHK